MNDDGRIALLERRTISLSERVERLEAKLAETTPPARVTVRATPPAPWLPPESSDVARRSPDPLAATERPRSTGPRDSAERRDSSEPRGSAPRPRSPEPQSGDALGWARVAAAATRDASRGPVPAASHRAGLEDLVAGRVLAWAGGAAVFVGLVLLFAVAISRGWVGEGARTLMGGLASFGLAAAGAWLHERRGRTDAAMAAAAAGIAGLFATSVVATRVYELLPVEAGMLLALLTGAAATAIAVRWESRGMATLGVLGGLAAPLLVGAPAGGGTVTILFVAAAAAVAICVHRGWDWLGLAAFAVVTPQWLAGLAEYDVSATATVATLAAFGLLFAGAAAGHDLRTRGATVRPAALLLLALSAFVSAAAGWVVVQEHASATAADLWLAAVAAAHLAGGLLLLRTPRASRPLALAALAIGAVVADVAIAQALNGLALALVWTGTAAGFAALARAVRRREGLEELALGAGLGTHLALALLHMLVVEAPPEMVAAGETSTVGAAAVAALAASCFASGALLDSRPVWRDLLHAIGLAALAFLAAVALDGAALVVAWAAEAAALATIARRAKVRDGAESRDGVAAVAGAESHGDAEARDGRGAEWVAGVAVPLQLALAFGGAVVLTAPAHAVLDGVADVPAALVALLAVAVASFISGGAGRVGAVADGDPLWRVVLHGAGVAALVWLAVVTLDGAVLVAVLATGAAVLAEAGRRWRDVHALVGGACVLGLAVGHALAKEAPPQALLDGVADLPAAALALAACALAAAHLAHAANRTLPDEATPWAYGFAGAIPLHLASVALVTAAGAGERAQMLLSALWAATGVLALIAGLVKDVPALRTSALALIGIALAKVFLYDLATLTALARVASFLALGLLLLAGAFAWQRIRPRPLPDLREAPPAARG